jgi:hypothetical protein
VKFTPKTERELAEEGMLPDGTVCDFEVTEAEDAVSKAGNDMIALKLKVWRPNGSTMQLRDWLVSSQHFKLMAFANATGMREAYDAGTMEAADMAGVCGKVKLGVEPASGDFPARNKVASYVKAETARAPAPATRGGGGTKPGPVDEDSIPFGPEWR